MPSSSILPPYPELVAWLTSFLSMTKTAALEPFLTPRIRVFIGLVRVTLVPRYPTLLCICSQMATLILRRGGRSTCTRGGRGQLGTFDMDCYLCPLDVHSTHPAVFSMSNDSECLNLNEELWYFRGDYTTRVSPRPPRPPLTIPFRCPRWLYSPSSMLSS